MTSRSDKSKLTFLVYDKEKTPYYISIKSNFLKFLLTSLPLASLFSIIVAIIIAYNYKRILSSAEREQPIEIQNMKLQVDSLEKQLSQEKLEIESLQNRLGQKSTSNFPELDLFQIPQGMNDKRTEKILAVEQFSTSFNANTLYVKFNISNLSPDRLAGHIHVIHYYQNKIQIYPADSFEPDTNLLKYNLGESFFTARFRPSQASFNLNEFKGSVKIIIFSRMGDLLFSQKYKLGES